MLFDIVVGDERVIAFASDRQLEMLQLSIYWNADGSFYVSTSLYEQVYTIYTHFKGEAYAIVKILI